MYGTLYTLIDDYEKLNERFKQAWRRFPELTDSYYFRECFATYFSRASSDRRYLVFAFPVVPIWYSKVIDQFNKEFTNIRYKILDEKDVYFNPNSSYNKVITSSVGGNIYPAKCPLFTIEFSKEYKEKSIYYLRYVLSIFLRLMSLVESKKFIKVEDLDREEEDWLEFLIQRNNSNRSYRSLSEKYLDRENFLNLDSPEKINHSFNTNRYLRQTSIMRYAGSNKKMWKIRIEYLYKYQNYTTKEWTERWILRGRLRYDYKSRLNKYGFKKDLDVSKKNTIAARLISRGEGKSFYQDAEDVCKELNLMFMNSDYRFRVEEF